MRVLVCGGRDRRCDRLVSRTLDAIDVTLLITGGARGIDTVAKGWAQSRGYPCMVMKANWGYYGKKAGPIRNGWMLEHAKPDLVVAFPGGRGTANMVEQARAAGVDVMEVAED